MSGNDGDWTGDWVVNEIAASVDRAGPRPVSEDHKPGLVHPDVDWLIKYLASLNRTGRSDGDIMRHAREIMYLRTALRHRGRGPVSLLGNVKSGFIVGKPIAKAEGLAKELQRLESAARSGSLTRWLRAWAAASLECRRLVWHPEPPPLVRSENGFTRAKLKGIVGADGVLIGPRPVDALLAIIRARRMLARVPSNKRQGKKRYEEAEALANAIQTAIRDLTGRAGRTDNRITGQTTGPLPDFGSAFDTRFGTGIRWRLIEKTK
jgi:hypothetical protein